MRLKSNSEIVVKIMKLNSNSETEVKIMRLTFRKSNIVH